MKWMVSEMAANGLMIDYEWCTGCHACEVACKQEHDLPQGLWGIKLGEIGPQQLIPGDCDSWEWEYVPMPTSLCDLCEELTSKGQLPSCVKHCLASVMEYGPVDELARKMADKGHKVTMFIP